jgi:hypothetical protein
VKATNPILLVLLFREAKASKELGPALWAALQEVESFYTLGWPRSSFRRLYLSNEVPDSVVGNAPLDQEATRAAFTDRNFWSLVKGRYTRTLDQNRLANLTREKLKLLAPDQPESSAFSEWLRTGRIDSGPASGSPSAQPGSDKRSTRNRHEDTRVGKDDWGVDQISKLTLIIVTDQEITPREGGGYAVSDDMVSNDGSLASVVSVATTDPLYWNEDNNTRLATIKQRVRSACLGTLGEYYGLKRCNNMHCFLYGDEGGNIGSITALDYMLLMGAEHRKKKLALHGFAAVPEAPEAVQPITVFLR